jgi:outer membrane cobalamin receptor
MPAGPNIKPQSSDQIVLGFYKKMPEVKFTAELYYKKMYHQIDYANHASMFLNPYIEGELRFGNSDSYGLELFLTKSKGFFTGWLGYSYTRTFRRIKDVNNNERFPATYDKPHYLTLNLSYKLKERWQFNMNWVYSSGIRFSAPTGFYYYQGQSIPVYTEKNNAKLPDYHRMDASASFRLNKNPKAKFVHRIMFSVYNLYARENPVSVNFNKIDTGGESYVVPADVVTERKLLPTQIYLFGAVPSLSYTFKFR